LKKFFLIVEGNKHGEKLFERVFEEHLRMEMGVYIFTMI